MIINKRFSWKNQEMLFPASQISICHAFLCLISFQSEYLWVLDEQTKTSKDITLDFKDWDGPFSLGQRIGRLINNENNGWL